LPIDDRARRMIALNDSRFAAMEQEAPERYARILQMTVDGMTAPAGWPDESPGDDNVSVEEGARLQLEARRGHDTWSRLPSLSLPVLVCGGTYDLIAPPANSEALAQQIPGAQLQMFEGGHLFLVQDRAAFPAMVAFLESS
jgi:3-oxoadipate enol-lactonase